MARIGPLPAVPTNAKPGQRLRKAGVKFRLGKIATINTDVSVVFPDATDYGDLAAGTTPIVACPVYRVYFGQDQLNAEPGEFNPSDDADGGFMYSLDISFAQYGVK